MTDEEVFKLQTAFMSACVEIADEFGHDPFDYAECFLKDVGLQTHFEKNKTTYERALRELEI